MLGNFSIGDYFKQGAVELAWELSLEGFGFDPDDIWITVFEGDEELGLGPDEEAIEAWLSVGVPRERIVAVPALGELLAGRRRPARAARAASCTSTAAWSGAPTTTCPAARTSASWSTGTSSSCSTTWASTRTAGTTLTPLPAKNIDTGLGLKRMAVIQQGVETVFETDTFAPLMALGRELARGRPRRARAADPRRPLARDDVPHRRRRRAVQRGPRLHPAADHAPRDPAGPPDRHRSRASCRRSPSRSSRSWARAYPELGASATRSCAGRAPRRRASGARSSRARSCSTRSSSASRETARRSRPQDAFQLHDTFGFPIDLTRELAAEQGLEVDTAGFDVLMEAPARAGARGRARGGRRGAAATCASAPASCRARRGFQTDFTGYETLEQHTTVGGRSARGRRQGARQARRVAVLRDRRRPGRRRRARSSARAATARRASSTSCAVGDDQALVVEVDERRAARRASASSRASTAPRAPRRRPTTPRRTCCTPRCASASARTCARPAPTSAPTSCASTSPTASGSRAEDLRAIEDRVNEWILRNDPVRPITTTLDEARALGAMALFGEKYGDVVRMVQIGDGDYSRELCGGTHVRSTAEIGVFKLAQRELERGQRAPHRGDHRPGGGRRAARRRRAARARPRRC